MIVEAVPIEYVHVVWPQVQGFIEQSIRHGGSGEYTIDQAKGMVALGRWRLIVASENATPYGAMLVDVYNRLDQRVAFVTAVGGRGIINENTFKQLQALVKSWGATSLECAARPSMQRMLERVGMKQKYATLGVLL